MSKMIARDELAKLGINTSNEAVERFLNNNAKDDTCAGFAASITECEYTTDTGRYGHTIYTSNGENSEIFQGLVRSNLAALRYVYQLKNGAVR